MSITDNVPPGWPLPAVAMAVRLSMRRSKDLFRMESIVDLSSMAKGVSWAASDGSSEICVPGGLCARFRRNSALVAYR